MVFREERDRNTSFFKSRFFDDPLCKVPPEQVAYLDQFLVECYYDAKK